LILRRALAALLVAGALGAAGVACPSRDLPVLVTADGVNTVIFACESFRDACKGLQACARNPLLCEAGPDGCTLRDVCKLPGGPEWTPAQVMGVELLLLEAAPGGLALRKKSPCVPLNVRPCIRDPTGVFGCADGAADPTPCFTAALATAVDSALGAGLTFSGFDKPDDVVLAAAFFRKPGNETSCDSAVLVSPDDCAVENLVAAAGLASPVGSATFDVTCASCESGPHSSLGRDNEACPVTDKKCFLQQVADVLAAAP